MKTSIAAILLLIMSGGLHAQQRDLDFYIEHAKSSSPLINKSKNENKIVSLDLKQINSILSKPEINIESGILFAPIISHDNGANRFEWVSPGASNYEGYDLAATDGGQYQAVVTVRQPLLAGSRLKSYTDKAGVSQQINENNIALTIHELEQLVGYQYLLCLKSKKQTDNSLLFLQELESQVGIMEKLVQNAIYKQTDLMLLQIEVQNYTAEHKMFQSEYETGMYDLNLICGIKDTVRVELLDTDPSLDSEMIPKSKFSEAFKLDSLSILADQAINELKYKPQLDLFASSGLNAVYLPAFNRLGLSTGITFTWNIFDGRQRDAQREKSAVNIQTLEFEKENFLTRNEISKRKILNQIIAVDQRITLNNQQKDRYDKLYSVYSKEITQGEASVMDFKNMLKDVYANRQENLTLKAERQLLVNSFNYLNY
ncbi:MAG TPA: TolC family protein [Bacteroidales bacterium]|nr:TolC family protein [Bacteroidales bacterium]